MMFLSSYMTIIYTDARDFSTNASLMIFRTCVRRSKYYSIFVYIAAAAALYEKPRGFIWRPRISTQPGSSSRTRARFDQQTAKLRYKFMERPALVICVYELAAVRNKSRTIIIFQKSEIIKEKTSSDLFGKIPRKHRQYSSS